MPTQHKRKGRVISRYAATEDPGMPLSLRRALIPIQNCATPHGDRQRAGADGNYADQRLPQFGLRTHRGNRQIPRAEVPYSAGRALRHATGTARAQGSPREEGKCHVNRAWHEGVY